MDKRDNGLPEYWVVKDDDTILFRDTIIKYMYEIYGCGLLGGLPDRWYGHDGNTRSGSNGCAYYNKYGYFKNNPVKLTITEFIRLSKEAPGLYKIY